MEDTINGLDFKTKEKDLKYKMLQDKVTYRLSETIATSFIKQFTGSFSFHYVGNKELTSLPFFVKFCRLRRWTVTS